MSQRALDRRSSVACQRPIHRARVIAQPLLSDLLKALGIAAVTILAPMPPDLLSAAQRAALERER